MEKEVIISAQSIIKTSLFGTKEILCNNVKGYRIGDKVIYIEPADAAYPKLTISNYIDFGNTAELKQWLSENFKDLNKEEYEKEKDAILLNPELGYTEEDRASALKRAGIISTVYNIGGFVLLLLSLLILPYNHIVDVAALVYPFVGVVIIYFSKGLIKLVSKKSSVYYHVFIGMYMPVLLVIIKSLINYNIISFNNLWAPAIVTGLILFTTLFGRGINRSYSSITGQLIFMVLIAGAYGYGVTVDVNCTYDQSPPQIFTATVVDNQISHGKSTTYYVVLSDWGQQKSERISVSRSFYYDKPVGSIVHVNKKPGLLKIPWFFVAR